MSFIKKHYRRLKKAIRAPHLISYYFREKASYLPYYLREGTFAFKPTEIKLYVNSVCNARCLMCDIGMNNQHSIFYRQLAPGENNQISLEICRRITEDVKHFKPKINISGTEPLLHTDLVEMVGIFKREGLYVSLSTNGMLLPELAEPIFSQGIDGVSVSLDGPERVHNQIRGVDIYSKAMAGIQEIVRLKRRNRSNNFKIGINFCITPLNYEHLANFAPKMIRDEKVDYVHFTHPYFITEQASEDFHRKYPNLGHITPTNIGMDFSKIDVDILWTQLQQLKRDYNSGEIIYNIDFSSRNKLNEYYSFPEVIVAKEKCHVPWKRVTILVNGDVVIHNRCVHYKTGNIQLDSFDNIWNGETYRVFRRKLKEAGKFPICSRCCGLMS